MDSFVYLLVAYGLCFGLMNDKAPGVPHIRKVAFVDRMLYCAYCTGFHCGWVVGLLRCFIEGFPSHPIALVGEVVAWGFASSAFCYIVDAGVQRLEKSPSD